MAKSLFKSLSLSQSLCFSRSEQRRRKATQKAKQTAVILHPEHLQETGLYLRPYPRCQKHTIWGWLKWLGDSFNDISVFQQAWQSLGKKTVSIFYPSFRLPHWNLVGGLGHPSEKYERQLGWWNSQYFWENANWWKILVNWDDYSQYFWENKVDGNQTTNRWNPWGLEDLSPIFPDTIRYIRRTSPEKNPQNHDKNHHVEMSLPKGSKGYPLF